MDASPPSLPFVVVDFISRQEIDIVNSNWLIEIDGHQHTYWPQFTKTEYKKLEKSVRNGDSPDAKSWKIYEVKVLKRFGKKNCFSFVQHI